MCIIHLSDLWCILYQSNLIHLLNWISICIPISSVVRLPPHIPTWKHLWSHRRWFEGQKFRSGRDGACVLLVPGGLDLTSVSTPQLLPSKPILKSAVMGFLAALPAAGPPVSLVHAVFACGVVGWTKLWIQWQLGPLHCTPRRLQQWHQCWAPQTLLNYLQHRLVSQWRELWTLHHCAVSGWDVRWQSLNRLQSFEYIQIDYS